MNIINKIGFFLRKYSPEIFLGLGIAATTSSVVLAIKETRKNEKDINELENKLSSIKNDANDGLYSKEEEKANLKAAYKQYLPKIIKTYAPSCVTLVGGILFFIASYNIQRSRQAALAVAYNSLSTLFKEYREEVKEKYGEEADTNCIKEANKKIKVENNSLTERHANNVFGGIIFDEAIRGWSPMPQYNLEFLLNTQACLNRKLKSDGYLFLIDVLRAINYDVDLLSSAQLKAAHHLGWIWNPDSDDVYNYVNFGLTNANGEYTDTVRSQLKSGDASFWLNFNTDGDILVPTCEELSFTKVAKRI